MKITWCGHSCFFVESAQGSVVFDPYAPGSVPGVAMPALCADIVVCSHGHGDHNYAEGVRLSGKTAELGMVQVPCFHDDKQGALRGKNLMTVIEAEGIRLAHVGDLGHIPDAEQLAALGRVDVLLVPVGGFYTIDARTADKLARLLAARIVIPMHYRGDGFGYDVIAPVDDFLALRDDVTWFKTNSIEISAAAEAMTAVLSLS